MTQQVVPLQPLPAQTFQAPLGNQNCQITLRQFASGLYMDLSIDGDPIISGKYCCDRVNLIRYKYLGFVGWLYFVDTTNAGNDPVYSGLGSTYQLVYESSP